MRRLVQSLLVTLIVSALAVAQPHVSNGKVETATAAGGLQSALRQAAGTASGPVWAGYAVPIVDTSKPRMICCGNYSSGENSQSCCGGCRLEGDNNGYVSANGGNCVQTEPATQLIVLLRYSEGQVTRVRAMTPGCAVDAGGLTLHWLTEVRPAESVALLASLADSTKAASNRVVDSAVMAIALHADASADATLNRLVSPDQPEKTREKTAFWIANERGKSGFATLQKLARDDKDDRFRRQLTFDLTLSHEPEAVPELIRMAHQDPDGGVRGQALFWLAQKAGKKVAADIAAAIENDPDTEVKKRAVFALSQIPDGEGVSKLIEVARNNRNPVVRKQAVFWLGQSHDPRALAFIEDVLTR